MILFKTILIILGFQIVWFACALGAAKEVYYLPAITGFLFITGVVLSTEQKKSLVNLILCGTLLGFLVDTILLQHQWIAFKSLNPYPINLYQPWWMTILWASFACSFRASFQWLEHKYLLSAVLGGIFGPIAYYSGSQLGAIAPISHQGLILVGLFWLISMPLMVRLSFRTTILINPK